MKPRQFCRSAARAACLTMSFAAALAGSAARAQSAGATTLAAYQTLEVCTVSDAVWRYHGEIAIWNAGAVDTQGLAIGERIQVRTGNAWTDAYAVPVERPDAIAAGSTQAGATIIPYSLDGAPLAGDIRNAALITILNHAGALGTPTGPEPKAAFSGTVAPCPASGGCVYTRAYWGGKAGVAWPEPYSRDAQFFLGGQTWQALLDAQVSLAQGYYQLAQQYIAAVLNAVNGALVPSGVEDTIALAETWLGANVPGACGEAGQCGQQKAWAAVLASYNEGHYPGGPSHCGDE